MKNKIIIYTAISNGYDKVKNPSFVSPNCDYICFSDTNIQSDIWEMKKFPEKIDQLDQVRKCRYLKINPHEIFPEYEYSIWIDGNIDIVEDVNNLISLHMTNRQEVFVTFKHPERNCIFQEGKECINQKKDDPLLINNQLKKYQEDLMPANNGLVESNVIIRKHNDKSVIGVSASWWKEIDSESRRDQLSFNYVAWKNNFKYGHLEGNSRGTSNYFKLGKHKKNFNDIEKFLKYRFGKIKFFQKKLD